MVKPVPARSVAMPPVEFKIVDRYAAPSWSFWSQGCPVSLPPCPYALGSSAASHACLAQVCCSILSSIVLIVDRDGDYGSPEDPSPYVHLAAAEEDVANMIDAEQVVIPRASIRVAVDYPLQEEHIFTLTSDDSAGFRRGELALKIAQLYQRIYAEEERSSAEPAGLVPGLLNRTRTEGTYDIWGHGLGDLGLVGVQHKPNRDVWVLEVDS